MVVPSGARLVGQAEGVVQLAVAVEDVEVAVVAVVGVVVGVAEVEVALIFFISQD